MSPPPATPPLADLLATQPVRYQLSMVVYEDGTAKISVPRPEVFWWLLEELANHARRLYAKQGSMGAGIVDPSGAVRLDG